MMVGSENIPKMVDGPGAQGPDLVGCLAQLFGDIIVRFLLEVSHDKHFAGRLLKPSDRIQRLGQFFRLDEFV